MPSAQPAEYASEYFFNYEVKQSLQYDFVF